MSRTTRPASRPTLIAALALLAVALLPAVATAEVSDSTWVMQGKALLKVKGTGDIPSFKVKIAGPALARFLPGGTFELEDAAEFVIAGDWSEVGDLDIGVESGDILAFLGDNLFDLPLGLVVDQLSSSVKLTEKKNGTSVLVYKLGFRIFFTVDGDDVELFYKLTVKGTNDLTGASSAGDTWDVDGKERFKTKGPKVTADAPLELVLGPDGGLPDNRFSLRVASGPEMFGGWYSRVGGRIALLPDRAALEAYVEAFIAPSVDAQFPGGTVTLEVFKQVWKAVEKKNGTLVLKGRTVFFGELDRGPQSGSFKSTYKVAAKG